MKPLVITFFAVVGLLSCAQSQHSNLKIPVGDSKKPTGKESVATFSEGCFWHTEIVFQSLEGVRDAVSGYAGGSTKNPDYELVSSGSTGHAETVQVYYDSTKISFATLVNAFFASHDPTSVNRQGNDVGSQYRSIAFYRNNDEKRIIEEAIKKITDSKKYKSKVVTEVLPYNNFYQAEDYHQEYILHHPENPYVENVSIPDYLEFKREFKGPFKS